MILSALLAKKGAGSLVDRLFHNQTGQILISALFGIALALLFQRACKGRKCIVIHMPPDSEDFNKVHNFNNECYKFNPRNVPCDQVAKE